MVNTVDIVTNSDAMLVLGFISSILIKNFMSNINFIDALGAGLITSLMFWFMTSFILGGMFGYKS